MTWPASDVTTTNVDATGDSPSSARANILDLMQKFNLLRNHVSAKWQSLLSGGAYTPSVAVAFSATPTFDSDASNVIEFGALTANVTTFTITNAVAGRAINIRFKQDGTGGRTVTLPANVAALGSVSSGANAVTWLSLIYVNNAGGSPRWEGAWTAI